MFSLYNCFLGLVFDTPIFILKNLTKCKRVCFFDHVFHIVYYSMEGDKWQNKILRSDSDGKVEQFEPETAN